MENILEMDGGYEYECEEAINFYRTENYIVKQILSFQYDECGNARLISNDIFYRRTRQRDCQYELLFGERRPLNGKRITVSMHSRSYVD